MILLRTTNTTFIRLPTSLIIMHSNLTSSANETYAHAIDLLNTLQSKQSTIDLLSHSKPKRNQKNASSIREMTEFIQRCGYQPDDLNCLNIVHVSGTKGKGTTCSYTESIIRSISQTKTGLYTSPHLLEVRERIRINGKPLEYACFARYFFEIWHRFCVTEENAVSKGQQAKPHYFRFLTCLAFHIFVQEKVRATIIEVGIGGMYDCTNIITKPICTAITSLGVDHTAILGPTISDIAAHKAGIMKYGIPCITVPQPVQGMHALSKYAAKIYTNIYLAQPVPSRLIDALYSTNTHMVVPDHTRLNLALAISVADVVLNGLLKPPPLISRLVPSSQFTFYDILQCEYGVHQYSDDHCLYEEDMLILDDQDLLNAENQPMVVKAIQAARSFGRNHHIPSPSKYPTFDLYLDGAHTIESIRNCVNWYTCACSTTQHSNHLIFNLTHNRDPKPLLQPLMEYNWTSVTFTTNDPFLLSDSFDTYTSATSNQWEMYQVWMQLSKDRSSLHSTASVHVAKSVDLALTRIVQAQGLNHHSNILVTGSLYLVAATYRVLGIVLDW